MLDELKLLRDRALAMHEALRTFIAAMHGTRPSLVGDPDGVERRARYWIERNLQLCADLGNSVVAFEQAPCREELLEVIESVVLASKAPCDLEGHDAATYHERLYAAARKAFYKGAYFLDVGAYDAMADEWNALVIAPKLPTLKTYADRVRMAVKHALPEDTPNWTLPIRAEYEQTRRWLERNGSGATDTPEPPAVLPPVVRFHDLELNVATWELKNCATGAEQDLGKSEGPQGPLCQLLIEAGGSSIMRSDAAAYVYKVPVGEVDDPLKQALDKACERLQIKLRRFGFDVEKNNGRWRLVEKQK